MKTYRNMAYDKAKLYEQAMRAIEEHGLYFIEDIVAFLPCAKETFYEKFPPKSDELDALKRALEANRVHAKTDIRRNLYAMRNNPTAQLALYRMIATPEERDALVMTKSDITSGGKALQTQPLTVEVIDSRGKVENPGTEE